MVDLSATPWYGSGSPKPEGTLFEWLVSDFSVYDAFESGLVKVVRLPDPDERGRIYIDLWDQVKGAKTKEEYLRACKGAVASIYASWKRDYEEWEQIFPELRGPSPVLLCVTNDATRAKWLFEHLSREYDLLRNPDTDDRAKWVTLQIDSQVFDADKGRETVIREMVNTVGSRQGKIVLAQYRGPADPDTGGAFTVKRYSSEKESSEDGSWRHTRVTLSPKNPSYKPIVFSEKDAQDVEVIAEFVAVLRGVL